MTEEEKDAAFEEFERLSIEVYAMEARIETVRARLVELYNMIFVDAPSSDNPSS